MAGARTGADVRSEWRHETVSVVLATYNGARFLGEQLESLRVQTRLPDELVVADDASSDDTVQIVRDFARRAPFPVRVIEQESHQGTGANFETAMRASSGAIIAICDQDDRWLPDKVAVMAEHMAEHPRALLAFSDAVLIDATGRWISRSRWRIAGFGPAQWTAMERDPLGEMLKRQVVSGCTAAVRRELVDALLPFPTGLHPALPAMMYDRWISLVAAAAGRVAIVPERLVEYRIHPAQQVGIPALRLRRVLPQTALRVGQFVAPACEKEGRFAYNAEHLTEILKRFARTDFDSAGSARVLGLAEDHLRLREGLNRAGTPRRRILRSVADAYTDPDGYRRFSLGLAAALSDVAR